jgi:hypothetical protein
LVPELAKIIVENNMEKIHLSTENGHIAKKCAGKLGISILQ